MTETPPPAPAKTPKTPPRFVPTLTEVVPQTEVMPSGGAELTPEMLDRLVSQATRRASEALIKKLPDLLTYAVQAQMPELVEHLRAELEAQALQSVRATLTRTGWQLPIAPQPPAAP